jgi:hypothetical protein
MTCIEYRVGPTVAGGYPLEEQVSEVFGGPQAPNFEDTNTAFEKGKPWCILIRVFMSLYFIIMFVYVLCAYVIGVGWNHSCIRLSFHVILVYLCSYKSLAVLCLVTRQ